MYRIIVLLGLLCITFFLTSCSLLHTTKEEDRVARCKMLNRDIIFNGATADQTVGTIERAQTETMDREFRTDDCTDLPQ